MGKSIQILNGNGTNNYTVSFPQSLIEESDLTCSLTDVGGVTSSRAVSFVDFVNNPSNVTVAGAAPAVTDVLTFTRTVPEDIFEVNWKAGVTVTGDDLELMYKHILQLYHQLYDGRFGPLQTNLDLNGNIIKNLGTGTTDTDSVNLGQMNTAINTAVSVGSTDVAKVITDNNILTTNNIRGYNQDGTLSSGSLANMPLQVGIYSVTTQTSALADFVGVVYVTNVGTTHYKLTLFDSTNKSIQEINTSTLPNTGSVTKGETLSNWLLRVGTTDAEFKAGWYSFSQIAEATANVAGSVKLNNGTNASSTTALTTSDIKGTNGAGTYSSANIGSMVFTVGKQVANTDTTYINDSGLIEFDYLGGGWKLTHTKEDGTSYILYTKNISTTNPNTGETISAWLTRIGVSTANFKAQWSGAGVGISRVTLYDFDSEFASSTNNYQSGATATSGYNSTSVSVNLSQSVLSFDELEIYIDWYNGTRFAYHNLSRVKVSPDLVATSGYSMFFDELSVDTYTMRCPTDTSIQWYGKGSANLFTVTGIKYT